MRHRLPVVILVVMAMSSVSLLLIRAEGEQPEGPVDQLFAQSIIVVTTKSTSARGATLQDVTARQLGGQHFLVGKAVDRGHPRDWQKNQTVWINVDDISQFTEFQNVEEMKAALESLPAAKP